jgi:hypothetical protein
MAEVAPAASALYLHPLTVRIGKTTDRPRDLLVERGPAAMCIELVFRPVERCTAPLALVRSGFGMALVFPGERRLGPFVDDHPLFRSCERTE